MGRMTDYAAQLAEELNQRQVPAITDPREAVAKRLPVVLVAPPSIDYREKAVRWRLMVLGPGPGTLAGWTAIDGLLDDLEAVLPLETADPGTYSTPAGDLACYVATFTA